MGWSSQFGQVVSVSDVLGNESTLHLENFGRLGATNLADGAGSEVRYADCADVSCWPGLAKMRIRTDEDSGSRTDVFLDSFGRVVGTETSGVIGKIRTETAYDDRGRVTSQSNPYGEGSGTTVTYKHFAYDDLNRVITVTEPVNDDGGGTKVTTFS